MDTEMNIASEQIDWLKALINEDQLDLEMSPVEKDTAASEIAECNDRLLINGSCINHQISEVTTDAIDFLYNEAMRLQINQNNFVTGLKLNLAADHDTIILLYQPVFMTRPPSSLTEPFYTVSTGSYYTYDADHRAFVEVDDADANNLIANHQSGIGIKHRGETRFGQYIPNVDTEAAIFPFQTIYGLLNDNRATSVFFHNSIRKEPVGGSYSIKHCLLLSSQNLQTNDFAGKFANRSHLCPPSCNSLQYALKF